MKKEKVDKANKHSAGQSIISVIPQMELNDILRFIFTHDNTLNNNHVEIVSLSDEKLSGATDR